MADSGMARISSTSPNEVAPNNPTLGEVTWMKKQATIPVTMPTLDVSGDPEGILINIKVYFAPTADRADLETVTPIEFPGNYPAGSEQSVTVLVPDWGTQYDFGIKVGN